MGLEARRDQVDPHLGLLHAADLHLRDPLEPLEPALDHVLDEVLHPIPGPVRGHVEAQDRDVLALEASDPHLAKVGGEEVAHTVDAVPDLDGGEIHVGPVLELEADAALARTTPARPSSRCPGWFPESPRGDARSAVSVSSGEEEG